MANIDSMSVLKERSPKQMVYRTTNKSIPFVVRYKGSKSGCKIAVTVSAIRSIVSSISGGATYDSNFHGSGLSASQGIRFYNADTDTVGELVAAINNLGGGEYEAVIVDALSNLDLTKSFFATRASNDSDNAYTKTKGAYFYFTTAQAKKHYAAITRNVRMDESSTASIINVLKSVKAQAVGTGAKTVKIYSDTGHTGTGTVDEIYALTLNTNSSPTLSAVSAALKTVIDYTSIGFEGITPSDNPINKRLVVELAAATTLTAANLIIAGESREMVTSS